MNKKLILIPTTALLLAACAQPAVQTPVYSELPTIEAQLDEQTIVDFDSRRKQGTANRYEGLVITPQKILKRPDNLPSSLFYDSGIHIDYPKDGVKGIYVPVDSIAVPEYFDQTLAKLNSTPLNTVVLDVKDDYGNIIPNITSDNPYVANSVLGSVDYRSALKTFEANNIYPIARIVTFKDTLLISEHPELSFQTETGETWSHEGDYYSNPFLKEVWDYNIAIAIEAAKMGFKEIQFDYVRFSDAFMLEEEYLTYSKGEFENYVSENPDDLGEERVTAITQFLAYAREQLAPYGVNVGADIFGYTAIANNAEDVRGIGQNFFDIAEQVDVISSMIYPSHWGAGFFGIADPDAQPYDTINEYMLSEKQLLSNASNSVISRPWLQNFSDKSVYTAQEIQAQIDALADNGIHEYLLWNAVGDYLEDVNYAPELTQ